MADRMERAGLAVAADLVRFIEGRALPGTGVTPEAFWRGLAGIVRDLGPANRALLDRRDALQNQIDAWHVARRGKPHNAEAYEAFLRAIGYIVPEGPDFMIETEKTDPEIAAIAGPQLVVPVMNARYALNAANARWGSLYDALYGTDALGDLPAGKGFDRVRGARVVAWGRAHLDQVAPLRDARWADVTGLAVANGALVATTKTGQTTLRDQGQFAGYQKDQICELQVLLRVNGLLIHMFGVGLPTALVVERAARAGVPGAIHSG
mgnify:CR=1 FL=1